MYAGASTLLIYVLRIRLLGKINIKKNENHSCEQKKTPFPFVFHYITFYPLTAASKKIPILDKKKRDGAYIF